MASPLRPALFLLALALALESFGQAAPAESGTGLGGARATVEILDLVLSRSDIRVPIPSGAGARFRYLPSGQILDFDRPLLLSATAGEERRYSVEIDAGMGITRREYLIDKRPPAPPRSSFGSGLYTEALELSLIAEKGASIAYALLDSAEEEGSFQIYPGTAPLRLEPPREGVRSWVLMAYAEDEAGNRSETARYVFRLAPPGLKAEEPPPFTARPEPLPDPLIEVLAPESLRVESGLELAFKKPRAGRLFAAVSPGPALGKIEAYAPLLEREGRAYLELHAPFGWTGELPVYLALELDGRLRYRSEPLRIALSALPAAPSAPPPPLPPSLLAGPPGSGAFLIFPSYEGEILLSLDGAPEESYRSPLAVKPGRGKLKLEWRGLSPAGQSSLRANLELERPPVLESPRLLGSEGPARGSSPRRLSAPLGSTIRYELAVGGTLPPEPTASSPLLEGELLLDCPAGEERSYALNYRPFTGSGAAAQGGDSTLLAFEIDRSPPPSPRIISLPAAYSLDALEIGLEAPEGRIFASLSLEGRSDVFRELGSTLLLPGSPDGPLVYTLRAYALDEAGNASPELGPLRFTVDSSSLYVDSRALAGGGGSPERPFSKLEDAIEASYRTGRRVLRLRGAFRLSAPLRLEGRDLLLEGGFDGDWAADPAEVATLELADPGEAQPPLGLSDSKLILRRIALRRAKADGRLIEIRGGQLSLEGASISADSDAELILVSIEGGKLSLKDSSLFLGGRGGGALLSAIDSELDIRGSELLSGKSLDYFTGIDAAGSSLLLEDSLLSGRASLGLVLLATASSTLEMDRSSLALGGGPGFLRAGRLSMTRGEIRNSRINLVAEGSALLFDLEDSPLSFVHDSLFAEVAGGRLRFFESRGSVPSFLNSLFYAPAGAELFLGSDREIRAGDISSCAFSGFSAYLSASKGGGSFAALAALNAKAGSPANIELPRFGAFVESPKDGLMPAPNSPLVDAASPLAGGNYARDFRGLPRPSAFGKGLPDIGADELGN